MSTIHGLRHSRRTARGRSVFVSLLSVLAVILAACGGGDDGEGGGTDDAVTTTVAAGTDAGAGRSDDAAPADDSSSDDDGPEPFSRIYDAMVGAAVPMGGIEWAVTGSEMHNRDWEGNPSGAQTLEVAMTVTEQQGEAMGKGVFGILEYEPTLRLPSGEVFDGTFISTSSGAQFVKLEANSTVPVVAKFERIAPALDIAEVADMIDGASLIIGEGRYETVEIGFDGAAAGAIGEASWPIDAAGSYLRGNDVVTMTVESLKLSADRPDDTDFGQRRAWPDQRFVTIEGTAVADISPFGANINSDHLVLVADGSPAERNTSTNENMAEGEMIPFIYVFSVPTSATELIIEIRGSETDATIGLDAAILGDTDVRNPITSVEQVTPLSG